MRKKKNSKGSGSGKDTNDLTKSITAILRTKPDTAFNYKQIAEKLGVDDANTRNKIIRKLSQLAAKKEIEEVERGKFKLAGSIEYYTGILDMTTKGFGYVVVEELDDDVFIPQNALNKAFDGDEVEIYIYNKRRKRKSEGEVVNIIKRKRTDFVGVLQLQENFGFVSIPDPKMYTDIFVQKNKILDAQNGDKVVVTLEEWPEKADSPFGKIKQVLGKPGC